MQGLDVRFQGDIGPDLSTVADRLSQAQIRAKIIDPTQDNPQTTMPAYQRQTELTQVSPQSAQQPILNEQQLNNLMHYMATLRTGQPR